MAKQRRRIKLIQPRLQLHLILSFLGVTVLALTLQFILFTSTLTRLAADLPQDGPLLLEQVPEHVLTVLLASTAVLLPLTFFVGVLLTFRIAGPLHRFEVFLGEVIRGAQPADCRLRQGDELKELCRLLNEATAPQRAQRASPRALSDPSELYANESGRAA